jgi:hypothetical protein
MRVFGACLAALALAVGIIDAWYVHEQPTAKPLRVLVVEQRALVAVGQHVPTLLKRTVARMDPDSAIEWSFDTVDPADATDLARSIERHDPRVVILLNENLLAGMRDEPMKVHFLVPSELPPETIRRAFGALRLKQDLAFMSWFVDGYPKSIANVRALSTRPVICIAGFFHTSLLRQGIERFFVGAARRQGVEPVVVEYADLDELERKMRAMRGRCQGFVIPVSEGISNAPGKVAAMVAESGLPAVYTRSDQVEAGGLVAVEAPELEIYEQLARYTVLMLHGARGSELEITQPSRVQMSINVAAARATGLTVPYDMLLEAAIVYP